MKGKIQKLYEKAETVADLKVIGQMIINSGLAPEEHRNNPEAIVMIIEHGLILGLSWSVALTNIYTIDGNFIMRGDALLGLVRKSGELEEFHSETKGNDDTLCTYITLKRKGEKAQEFKYSVQMAIEAGIIDNWWKRTPERKTYYKALGYGLRTVFSDITQGMYLKEELDFENEDKSNSDMDIKIAAETLKMIDRNS